MPANPLEGDKRDSKTVEAAGGFEPPNNGFANRRSSYNNSVKIPHVSDCIGFGLVLQVLQAIA